MAASNGQKDYTQIDHPYSKDLSRDDAGSVGQYDPASFGADEGGNYVADSTDVQTGSQFSDIWVNTWIKSRGYKPGTVGFFLDGGTGRSEFAGLLIGRGGIRIIQTETGVNSTNALYIENAADYAAVDIRKTGIGNGIYIESLAGSAIEIDQRTNTPAVKATGYAILPGSGGVIEGVTDPGVGQVSSPAVLGRTQTGHGIAVYGTVEDQLSSGYPLRAEQGSLVNAPFFKIAEYEGSGSVISKWVAAGVTPNGSLSGNSGDVCYSTNGKMYVCQGGTSWTEQGGGGSGDFGDGSDGDVVISSGTTTLTRDMYYENLTVNGTGVLNPGGYHIFVNDTLTVGTGIRIARDGNDADDAVGQTGGSGGNALASGTLYGALGGEDGSDTGGAPNDNGVSGSTGVGDTKCLIDGTSAYGGYGGNGGGGSFGGTRGDGTTPLSTPTRQPRTATYAQLMTDTDGNLLRGGPSAGSGASGGNGDGANWGQGGGGGGSGGNGGIIVIHARYINSSGSIRAKGGNGGNGADAVAGGTASSGGGGGGGGGGGTGGVVVVVTTVGQSEGAIAVGYGSGGAAGSGASGPAGSGTDGESGSDGLAGLYISIKV